MKTKFAAIAALVGCAATAYAQSSVTLYGAVDVGVLHQSTSGPGFLTPANRHANDGGFTGYKDGGIYASNLGFKGSEDMGGGYSANFKFQGTVNTSTGGFGLSDTPGGIAMFNQYAMMGVSGPFGSLDAGRQIVPMIWAMADTDVRHAQYFGSIFTAWIGMNQAAGWVPTSSNAPIGAVYDSSAFVYHSPNFGGVTLELEYAFGNAAASTRGGSRESVVLRYVNDGVHLAAAYYNGRDTNPFLPAGGSAPLTGQNNNRFYYLGGLYTFKGFTVSTSYSAGKNPSNPGNADLEMYSVGFGYRFSPVFDISSGIYHLKSKSDTIPGHSTAFAIGANYSLSKRTMLYAQMGRVINKGDAMNQTISYGSFVAPNTSTNAFMLGIRNSF